MEYSTSAKEFACEPPEIDGCRLDFSEQWSQYELQMSLSCPYAPTAPRPCYPSEDPKIELYYLLIALDKGVVPEGQVGVIVQSTVQK